MDVVENQQRLIDAAVSATFTAWRSQLRVHLEESHALKGDLEKKTEELRQLQQSISDVDAVRQENKRLKDELLALQSQQKSTTSLQRYQELEHERDALHEDNRLKQETISTLKSIVKYEKSKSKDWSRHSNSSPGIWGHGTSPRQPSKASEEPQSTTLADEASPLSNQALPQKLALPLENAGSPEKSPTPVAEGRMEEPIETVSVDESTDENALQVQQPINQTGHLNGPMSFPDFDTTYSYGDFPSELPPTTSPRSRPSPFVRRPSNSPLLPEVSVRSVTEAIPSDSIATPSRSCRKHEYNETNLPHSSFSDSLDVFSPRPLGRRAQNLNDEVGDAKLERSQAGNAEQQICVKSEPPESLQNAAATSSDLTLTVEEPRRRKSFDSPRRNRDPQLLGAASGKRFLHMAEDENVGSDTNHSGVQPVASLSALEDDERARDSPKFVQSKPLQEIKNEMRVLRRTSNASCPPVKKRRWNNGRGATAISSIAEDGEHHNRSHKRTAAKLPRPTSARSTTSGYRRLDNLLEGPSPVKHVLGRPSPVTSNLMDGSLLNAAASANSARKDQLDAVHLSENKSREWYESAEDLLDSLHSRYPPQPKRKSADASPEGHAASRIPQREPQRTFVSPQPKPPDGSEDEKPFRSRPLHELHLDHFKINPKVNAGVGYAYMDVIRNRDQRKCLPGCTRPECCGSKFRAVATTLPKLTPNAKQFLVADPLDDASSQQSDHNLLVNFLGPGNEEKIRTLTSLARENLLLEAKTKIAADRYGKMHRHAHDRPKSPPGFWRTEMPETQEGEVDRLDAKTRERDEVERRYREACKEGGRWVFADE